MEKILNLKLIYKNIICILLFATGIIESASAQNLNDNIVSIYDRLGCVAALSSVKSILDDRNNGENVGMVPEAFQTLNPISNIDLPSINEDPFDKNQDKYGRNENMAWCFKVSGTLSNVTTEDNLPANALPRINAFVFFNTLVNVESIKRNLSVGLIQVDETGNRRINLSVAPAGKNLAGHGIAGVSIRENKIDRIDNQIIWLKPNLGGEHNVVLCEGSCSDIYNVYFGTSPVETILSNDGAPLGAEKPESNTAKQLENNENTRTQPVTIKELIEVKPEKSQPSIEALINTKIKVKLLKADGKPLVEVEPSFDKCNLDISNTIRTANEILLKVFSTCVKLDSETGWAIDRNFKPEINWSKSPTISFQVEKARPVFLKEIVISATMEDNSIITRNCTFQVSVVDKNSTRLKAQTMLSPGEPGITQIFAHPIPEQVEWKDAILQIDAFNGADCRPKNKSIRIPISQNMIELDGILKLEIILESSLGNALVLLSTFTGIASENGSDETQSLHALKDDIETREIFAEFLQQSLLSLRGNVKKLDIGQFDRNGRIEFSEFAGFFENDISSYEDTVGTIANQLDFPNRNFSWTAIESRIPDDQEFSVIYLVGQTGLNNDQSYCSSEPNKFSSPSDEVSIVMFSFGADENIDSPRLNDLDGVFRKFPVKKCENSNHYVFFPDGRRSGWREGVEAVFSNVAKSIE